MVILQVPVWLLSPDIWISLFPLISLWTLLPSYQAIPQPQISSVPPNSPRAPQISQKHCNPPKSNFWVSHTALPLLQSTLLTHLFQLFPRSFPISVFYDGIATFFKITCPGSLYQIWFSPPVTTPRYILWPPRSLVWTHRAVLLSLHLLLCPHMVADF